MSQELRKLEKSEMCEIEGGFLLRRVFEGAFASAGGAMWDLGRLAGVALLPRHQQGAALRGLPTPARFWQNRATNFIGGFLGVPGL